MKGMVLKEFGQPLVLDELDDPKPGPGEVLVESKTNGLCATDLKIVPRLGWLLAMAAAAFVLHVLGVALLARGGGWASESGSPEDSGRLGFSLFAGVGGLRPPAGGGGWGWAGQSWGPRGFS